MTGGEWLQGRRVLAIAMLAAAVAIGCATGAANVSSKATASSIQTTALPTPVGSATPQALPTEDTLPAVTFYTQSGALPQLHVLIEDTEAKTSNGLMNVQSMPNDIGAVFIFDGYTTTPFYMKDTLIPLTVAWIDENGIIVDMADMAPQTTDDHFPSTQYRYAIEANLGWYAQNGVNIGDYVDLTAAYAASPVYGQPAATPTAPAGG